MGSASATRDTRAPNVTNAPPTTSAQTIPRAWHAIQRATGAQEKDPIIAWNAQR